MRWLKRFVERWIAPGGRRAGRSVTPGSSAVEVTAPTDDEVRADGGADAQAIATRAARSSPVVPPARRPAARPTRLGLALQGGGAHGAFTWGVLDRLLDEPRLAFPIVTGASAGALNGALLVTGHAAGGRAGAQKALADFWEGLGRIGSLVAPFQSAQGLASDFGFGSAGLMQALVRMWSPAQLNPFNLNPLRDLLEKSVDEDALRRYRAIRLVVAATNVETGAPHLFAGDGLTIDALMASACLPTLYQAVPIDGVAYWDGGYSANPPLTPLIAAAADDDGFEALLVQINPEHRTGTPTSAADILHRINEITFNAGLLAELRQFEAVEAASGRRRLCLHRLALHEEVEVPGASAASLDEGVHRTLRDAGRRAAERWLDSGWRVVRRTEDAAAGTAARAAIVAAP